MAISMIRSKKRITLYSLKMAFFIPCLIAVAALLSISEEGLAMSNKRLITKAGLRDTLVCRRGKIVDSIMNIPIPFSTITFYKEDSTSLTILSNENGEFSTDVKNLRSKVKLSAIGYQESTYYFVSGQSCLFRLTPTNNILPNVIVSSKVKKKPNANRIIKKVNKYIEQNYGNISFDQKFKVYLSTFNYDTIKGKSADLIDLHFNRYQKSLQVKKWCQDTLNFDTVFFNFIGVPRLSSGDIITKGDILRRGLILGEKQSKNFDFRLLAHYKDKIQGNLYLVSFKPHSTTYNDFFMNGSNLPLGYLKGEILIREDDYAVVSLKYIWELKVERLNKALENAYLSPYWKADKLGKIVANSIIFKHEYSYTKDIVIGKYFVQSIKTDCYETGYQIENGRKVELYFQYNATGLDIQNIVD